MKTKPRAASLPLRFDPEPVPSAITDALRMAMKESGLSCYEMARRSGVNVAAILRFLAGERSMTLPSVDRLAEVLGLELMKRTSRQ